MKKSNWLAVLFFSFFFVFSAFGADNPADSIAIVSKFSGSVQVYHVREWKSLSIGMPVYEGDVFRTNDDSFAEILFDSATLMRVDSNSELVISELKRNNPAARTIFKLLKGRVMAIVDKLKSPDSAFEVRTKMAIAAVKGTELSVTCSEDGSTLGVYEGSVEYSNADGSKTVRVTRGNGSWIRGSNGSPSTPEKLRPMLNIEKNIDGMREDVKVYRDMSRNGKNVREWLIQRSHADEQGNATGSSETNLSVGGTNAGHQAAVKTVKENIKNRLRNEMIHTRAQAINDLGFVNEQMRADLHLGKTMTDVHGNRVRIEEYIFRPEANEVDLLSLTLRDTRMDYLRTMNIFNRDLPAEIPKYAWNSKWNIQNFPNMPDYYRTSTVTRLSNMDDMVEMINIFGYEYFNPADPVRNRGFCSEPVKENLVWRLNDYEYSLALNDVIYEHKKNVMSQVSGTVPVYTWIRMTDDKTFTNTNEVENTINEMAIAGNLEARTELYDELAANFGYAGSALDSNNLNDTLDPYFSNKANADGSGRNGYFNTDITLFNPDSTDLAVVGTRNYNDGTTLSTTVYLINDYGKIKAFPTDLGDWVSLIFDTNIELQLKSNRFADQELGIDVVSKLLWGITLNPKNEAVYDDGSTTRQ
ncbi:MAG: FecR family protein [Spirochaetia bacterium]|nr:FecR family protein [Spirochaetia bacterium]